MQALDLGASAPKDSLADRLWDGRPPGTYIGTLESYVCLLRRRLAGAGVDRDALATTGGGYRLDPRLVSVDLAEVRGLLVGSNAEPAAAEVVAHVLSLLTGELLADDPYAPWAVRARDDLAQTLAEACVLAAREANRTVDRLLPCAWHELPWPTTPPPRPAHRS